ncbi:hypothetical protein G6F33_008222 [Rhizopus arrhizus]|nr:hypothetical protein G6F24_004499 [Rhizopus arrhizus]KAG0910063.1 hypothetical protein G6F33_008222 [Rhizopus arrhizus]
MEHIAPIDESNYYNQQIQFSTQPLQYSILPSSKPRPRSTLDEQWKTTSKNESLKAKKDTETWKMSAKPRHAQLIQDDRRQSAPLLSNGLNRKPLPREPIQQELIPMQSEPIYPYYSPTPFQTTPQPSAPPMIQQQPGYLHHYPTYPLLYTNNTNHEIYPSHNSYPVPTDYIPPKEYPSEIPLQPQEYSQYDNHNYSPTAPAIVPQQCPPQTLSDPPVEINKNEKKESNKNEKKTRQITVQSINKEHRVWIDVLPSETGLSLAEKIHIIATFRTRKIVSITTASGRKVPLDNRPVFGNWVDMDNFENGERWSVEWCENDRGVMDRFLSKVVQAGGGKRHKDHIAKDST